MVSFICPHPKMKFIKIIFTTYLYTPYKPFYCTFLWACRSLCEPQKYFSNSLLVHLLVCQITHSFLNGFQPNLYQHFSHICSTCYVYYFKHMRMYMRRAVDIVAINYCTPDIRFTYVSFQIHTYTSITILCELC